MKKLILYSRIECPLCEFAAELLQEAGIEFEEVDIEGDERLIKAYHTSIPVLQLNDKDLKWPFTADDAMQFITRS